MPWMQVVPTTYVDSHNRTIQSNQYSVTEHFKPTMDVEHAGQLPGVFIFYDLSPIKVGSLPARWPVPPFAIRTQSLLYRVYSMLHFTPFCRLICIDPCASASVAMRCACNLA